MATSPSNWIVKQVQSGDVLTLIFQNPQGTVLEKQVILSDIVAPKMTRTMEIPWAFESREFLRKNLVGQSVKVETVRSGVAGSTREIADVFFRGDNVAHVMLKHGWATVKENAKRDEMLISFEREARDHFKGMFSKTVAPLVPRVELLESEEQVSKLVKGKTYDAIIEHVKDGSSFRVLLMDEKEFRLVNFSLAGVQANSLSDAYGTQARMFVELRLLHRQVKCQVLGSFGTVVLGTVIHPAGNIASLLLKEGFARIHEKSISLVPQPEQLLQNEQEAKKLKKRLFQEFEPQKHKSEQGKVIQVLNGESFMVSTGQSSHKVFLSSIRQPQSTRANESETGYQLEAKEFLRKKLIGKKIEYTLDYTKSVEGMDDRLFFTVLVSGQNVAALLLERGLASLWSHSEQKSSLYDQLVVAEAKAIQEKVGIHSQGPLPVTLAIDASASVQKAKTFLSSLSKGKMNGVVEYVFNGSRVRVWIPKEKCKITMILAGISAPRVTKDVTEEYGPESLAHLRELVFQRDVELSVVSVDKNGSFVGSLFVQGEDVALKMVTKGLAWVHSKSAPNNHGQLIAAERNAKEAKLFIWEKDQEEHEDATFEPISVQIVVSDIQEQGIFYFQKQSSEFETLMDKFRLFHLGNVATPTSLTREKKVSAQFVDGQWYRAIVKKRLDDDHVQVFFIDYGNTLVVSNKQIRELPQSFDVFPAQAIQGKLAFINIPEHDYASEAIEFIKENIPQTVVSAIIEKKEHKLHHLTLFVSKGVSLNELLVRNGLAWVDKHENIKNLVDAQIEARANRINLWRYGDFTDDE